MAAYSQSSSYDASPWQPDAFKQRDDLFTSSITSVKYEIETITDNDKHSEILEDAFKSKLNIASNVQSSTHSEEAETKLNTELSAFIDKIRYLEKQREILEDRWSLLQVEESSQNDLEPVYLSYISRLLGQVNSVTQNNHQTQRSLLDMMDSLNDIKDKFEDETCLRTDLEYSFVQMKKDVDSCSLDRTELELKQKEMKGLIELMKVVYEQELKEVMQEAGDISVLVNMDNSCPLNLESVVREVKERYEMIASRSREEAQALSRRKLQQGVVRAGRFEEELESTRSHITQLNSKVQRLRSEVLRIQDQCIHLEQEVSQAKKNSDTILKDANEKLTEVKDALQKAKQDVACQLREYQELMNVKLSLDIEIMTYKKLLEGEESRLQAPPHVVSVQLGSDVRGHKYQGPSRFQKRSTSKSLRSKR
ncbi:keratin, type II cytoskeletal 80-like [Rhinophrynus dorsalis]